MSLLRENQDEVEWNERLVDKINDVEVLYVINKIKYRKAVEPDELPVNVWKVLEEIELKGSCSFSTE